MIWRKARDVECRFLIQAQGLDPMSVPHRWDQGDGRFGKREPSEGMLDRNFPGRDRAKVDFVVRFVEHLSGS